VVVARPDSPHTRRSGTRPRGRTRSPPRRSRRSVGGRSWSRGGGGRSRSDHRQRRT